MLLIGSHALIEHVRPLGIELGRRPRDIDVIATFDELTKLTFMLKQHVGIESIPLSPNKTVLKCFDGRIIEVELAWPDSPARGLLDRHECRSQRLHAPRLLPVSMHFASLDELYTLKMSHRYLKDSPHFMKTRSDILRMRTLGAKIFDPSWLKAREDETYWYKHPKLNVMKKDFFTGDGVHYVYDHDDIHKAVAHVRIDSVPTPAYTLYMKDGEEVKSDRRKFFDHDESVRLFGVLEEAQVLALERSQIPFRGKVSPRRSFDMALRKVCTSITSGWFREFGWESFDRVEAMYEEDYVDRFWKSVDDGRVRKL